MRDHVHTVGAGAELVAQALRSVLGVHDHRVHAIDEPARCRDLPRLRLARENVVRGEHARALGRQQVHVERLHREPLPVHHVGLTRTAAVAQHVRHVLRELHGHPPARLEAAPAGERGRSARARRSRPPPAPGRIESGS